MSINKAEDEEKSEMIDLDLQYENIDLNEKNGRYSTDSESGDEHSSEEDECHSERYHLLGGDENFNKNFTCYREESGCSVLREMALPFTLAGVGLTFAGIVLNRITTRWPIFRVNPQFEIMIPAFIGLIGNIQTTLASRLSTHANLGTLDAWSGTVKLLTGNYLVVLCQAAHTGLFAALASLGMAWFGLETWHRVNWENTLLLCASSIVTSLVANALLATLIITVIVTARKCRLNPGKLQGNSFHYSISISLSIS